MCGRGKREVSKIKACRQGVAREVVRTTPLNRLESSLFSSGWLVAAGRSPREKSLWMKLPEILGAIWSTKASGFARFLPLRPDKGLFLLFPSSSCPSCCGPALVSAAVRGRVHRKRVLWSTVRARGQSEVESSIRLPHVAIFTKPA